jgi:ankyrin repeat protein
MILARYPQLMNQSDHEGKTPLHYAIQRATIESDCTNANVLLAA